MWGILYCSPNYLCFNSKVCYYIHFISHSFPTFLILLPWISIALFIPKSTLYPYYSMTILLVRFSCYCWLFMLNHVVLFIACFWELISNRSTFLTFKTSLYLMKYNKKVCLDSLQLDWKTFRVIQFKKFTLFILRPRVCTCPFYSAQSSRKNTFIVRVEYLLPFRWTSSYLIFLLGSQMIFSTCKQSLEKKSLAFGLFTNMMS